MLKSCIYMLLFGQAAIDGQVSPSLLMRERLSKATAERRLAWLEEEGKKLNAMQCEEARIVQIIVVNSTQSEREFYCPGDIICRVSSDFARIKTACDSVLMLSKRAGIELDTFSPLRKYIPTLAHSHLPLALWDRLIELFPESKMPLYALPLVYEEGESAHRSEMTDPNFTAQFKAIASYQQNDRYYHPYMHNNRTFQTLIDDSDENFMHSAEKFLRRPQLALTKLKSALLKNHPNGSRVLKDISQMPKADIVSITSSGTGQSRRHTYLRELLKYIAVDYWGKAVRTRNDLPSWWATGNVAKAGILQYDIKRILMSYYPFYLAFENAICRSYVSEKVWHALQVGTIPIYIGTKDVARMVPHPDAVIQTRDFESPKALANYLKYLLATPEKLEKHRSAWRKANFQKSFYAFQAQSIFSMLPRHQSFCPICRDIRDGTLRKLSTTATPWQKCEPPPDYTVRQ